MTNEKKRRHHGVKLGVYRHYKGALYTVVEILPDETGDSDDWIVCYEAMKPRAINSYRAEAKVYDRYARSAKEFGEWLGPITARYARFHFLAASPEATLLMIAEKHLPAPEPLDGSDADY